VAEWCSSNAKRPLLPAKRSTFNRCASRCAALLLQKEGIHGFVVGRTEVLFQRLECRMRTSGMQANAREMRKGIGIPNLAWRVPARIKDSRKCADEVVRLTIGKD